MATHDVSSAADSAAGWRGAPPAPHGATGWTADDVARPVPDQRVAVDEDPRELVITIRHDRRPDAALDGALALWAWLQLALLVLAGRLAFGAPGIPSLAASASPWLVAPLLGTLAALSAAGAILIRARLRRAEDEVLRTDGHTLWVERHAPLEVHTRAFEVEQIHEFRVTRPHAGDPARWPRRWWPQPRLAFEVEGRTTRLGRGLDTAEAVQVLEAIAPWLEGSDVGTRRVVPHGVALATAVPPELGEGATRCGRCGAEHAVAGDATIAWCDGCAAWVEVLREPSSRDAAAASRLVRMEVVDEVPVLVLTRRPIFAVRVRTASATSCLGGVLVAAVSAFALAAPTIPEDPVRLTVIAIGLASATVAALSALAWSLVRQPPHRIVLLADGLRIEWRRGPWVGAAQLAYERITSLDVRPGRLPALIARMGAVTVPIATGLPAADARRLAEAIRHHAIHAAWRAGRIPGWVPRMDLACRHCGERIEPRWAEAGAAPDPVRCERCEREWPLAEAVAPSLARIDLDAERSDQLEVSASPVHGTVVRVRTPPAWRRLASFLPALALCGGGWIAFEVLPRLGVTSLRTWSVIAVGSGVLLALRALGIATVRAHELRVSHEALTVRRVRLIGSTDHRIAIERVAAVVRPARGRRAAEDEPRRAAVRILVRRLVPLPGLGPERIRLGAHLSAHEQLWLARTLDRLIFETAYPPEKPDFARRRAPEPAPAAVAEREPVPEADHGVVAAPTIASDAAPHGSDTNERMSSR